MEKQRIDPNEFYSLGEALKFTPYSYTTLRRELDKGILPHTTDGRNYSIKGSDLAKFLEEKNGQK